MASPVTIGHIVCANCGERVAVKRNKNGYPYARCSECDEERRQHSQEGTRKFMAKVTLKTAPVDSEKAEKSEPVPVEKKKSTLSDMLNF